jgi:hypothetical protein
MTGQYNNKYLGRPTIPDPEKPDSPISRIKDRGAKIPIGPTQRIDLGNSALIMQPYC